MEQPDIIPAEVCCMHYNIELSFVEALVEHGLLNLRVDQEKLFIHPDELPGLEKYVHLHYDLNINLEGLEAITHLLERVGNLQQEMIALQNRLVAFERE